MPTLIDRIFNKEGQIWSPSDLSQLTGEAASRHMDTIAPSYRGQDFAEAQIRAVCERLREEFPEHDVWVGASDYYCQIDYFVDDHTGACSAQRFPGAIEEIVDFVRAELG